MRKSPTPKIIHSSINREEKEGEVEARYGVWEGDGPEMGRVCTRWGCGQVRKAEREEKGNALVWVERWTRNKKKRKRKREQQEARGGKYDEHKNKDE